MHSHEAFFLLCNSLGVSRLQFLLRTAPCCLSEELEPLEEELRLILEAIANIQLSPEAWRQASLPVRWGGVGLRGPTSLAPSAYLASLNSSASLLGLLLPPLLQEHPDGLVARVTERWVSLSGSACPAGQDASRQRAWDDGICHALSSELLQQAGSVDRARLLASTSPGSGAWLQAFPSVNLGLRLGRNELRVAIDLRVGAPLVRAHRCLCGAEVDRLAHHGLSCRRSAGRHRRHAWANDAILRAIRSTNTHAELEPPRLLRSDGKRPDGATLDPWTGGRYLVWDFTCPDTLAPSHLTSSMSGVGGTAQAAESRKVTKYQELVASGDFLFAPVAIETLGTWGTSAITLCQDLGARIAQVTGDPRSLAFLKQRLSLAVQRGNAASVLGTHSQSMELQDLQGT